MVDGSTQCYYLDASRNQQGPASVSDLARLVRSGAITRDTMIWFAGMPDWRPAGQVNELTSLFGPPGPPSVRPPMPPAGAPLGAGLGAAPGSMRAPARDAGFGGGFDSQAAPGNWAPPKSYGFMGAITAVFSKYVGFNGRASRSEFWWWFLFEFIVLFVAAILDGIIFGHQALFYFGGALALFLPTLAVSIRRLHDTDKSGWFFLLFMIPLAGLIIMIIFCTQQGTNGPNRFDVPSGA
jgi:uncharacterized membrane protein YhaH (DUF805 family)